MSKTNRFINTWGWILVALFAYCLSMYASLLTSETLQAPVLHFFTIMGLWYLTAGVGLLMRKTWGYYLFKALLYLLLIGFPIGTFISYKSLRFMRENSIKNKFNT